MFWLGRCVSAQEDRAGAAQARVGAHAPLPQRKLTRQGDLSTLQHLATVRVLCLNLQENNRAGYKPVTGTTPRSLPPAAGQAGLPSAGSPLRLCKLFVEGSARNSDSPRTNREALANTELLLRNKLRMLCKTPRRYSL